MKPTTIQKVLVIGCGGTGSMLAMPLARFLHSLRDSFNGNLVFADGDTYSESNTDRQNFNPKYLGTNKAEYTAMSVQSNLPWLTDQVAHIAEYLSKADMVELITDNTIVINCADNKAIRKYVEDRVNELGAAGATIAHICCGNEMIRGQVQANYWKNGSHISNSIYDSYPEFNNEDGDRSIMNCEQLAALPSGGQVICSNMMAASLALMYFYQITSDMDIFADGTFLPNSGTSFHFGFGTFTPLHSRKACIA